MQIIPNAVGQSEELLVFWDENPETGIALPRAVQMITGLQWGLGALDHDDCLILYLFSGEQAVELYLPQRLPTTQEQDVDVWDLLWTWNPQVFKIRYGSSPLDRAKEVTVLLPKGEGESVRDRLRDFVKLTDNPSEYGELAGIHGELLARLQTYVSEQETTAE